MADPCTETFSTAKACMGLSQRMKFIGCQTDSVLFNASGPIVIETFVRNVLSSKLQITGSTEVVEATKSYVMGRDE